MRHNKSGRQFSRDTSSRRAMLRSLAANLITHERIHTTDAKAKELRRVAEGLIGKALRLDPDHESHDKTEAEIAFTEAKKLEAEGRPDAFLLRRALELDPGHQGAKEALAGFEQRVILPPTSNVRWAAAGG